MVDSLPTSLPDAPRAGGETPTIAELIEAMYEGGCEYANLCELAAHDLASQRTKQYRNDAQQEFRDARDRLLAALPSLLERQRDGERDTKRLTWVLGNTYQGIMLEPSAVRPELVEDRDYYGPWYVHSREDIDNAMPVSAAPSAERA